MTNQEFELLLERYKQNQLTEEEIEAFMHLIAQGRYRELVEADMQQSVEHNTTDYGWAPERKDKVLSGILKQKTAVKVIPLYKRSFFKVAAASVAILIIAIGIYRSAYHKTNPAAIVKVQKPALINDLKAPASNNAVITLANGEKIILDGAGNGTLAMQGNIQLVKLADGQIAYTATSKAPLGKDLSEAYNTLANPKGSRVISLALADGTKVWLNAESALKYPAAFTGNERKVEITGEAYFEVAHNAAMPFKVKKGNTEITVLGTHFNVNAYDDETLLKVTLLEGGVKVTNGTSKQLLLPGQQAQLNHYGQINLDKNADMEQVMAWKNGVFNFNKTQIGAIMRQIEKWYDVEVAYKGKMPNITLSGIISRNINATKVLEMLELSGVHFKIEGKKIVVMN